jgi:CheY-like chemotaxis protein/predicted  nucleic acid-binding Zn-ribbon protein
MGQRLLIVDSDRTFLAEQRVSLESAFEVEVLASPDGESLLGRVESGDIAAVLICVEVSENKGYAFCTNLRKLQAQKPTLAGIKIALISAKATEEEYKRHQGLKGRADLYLHKPIPPGALVAALGQLVPPRPVDPHNPLGDLADSDNDDFFSDLKNLEVDQLFDSSPAPSAAPVATAAAAVTQHLDPVKTAPPHVSHAEMAQAQVEGLLSELRAKEQELVAARAEAQAARAELQQVQRRMDSATRNLEELEQQQRASEKLHSQLAEAQAALQKLESNAANSGADLEALKTQLRSTLEEKQEHLHHIEELNQQVAEKTQKALELLRERDRLQSQVLELESVKAQAEQAQKDLAAAQKDLTATRTEAQAAKARLEAMEEMLQRLPVVENELASTNAELTKARNEARQFESELKALQDKHASLEAAHATLDADLKAKQDEAKTLRQEMSGLEATMRGQGRELAELQQRIQETEASAEKANKEAAELNEKLRTKDENLEKMGNEIFSISAQRNDLQQRLDDSLHARETERMELLQGLDEKEAELQQAIAHGQQLDREKQGLEGKLAEKSDRLASLSALLADLSERLKKGADLAQG